MFDTGIIGGRESEGFEPPVYVGCGFMLALFDTGRTGTPSVFETGTIGGKESEGFEPPVFVGCGCMLALSDAGGAETSSVFDNIGLISGGKVSEALGPVLLAIVGNKPPVFDTEGTGTSTVFDSTGPIGVNDSEDSEPPVFVGSGGGIAVFDIEGTTKPSVFDSTEPTGGRRDLEGFEPSVFEGSGTSDWEVFGTAVFVGPAKSPVLDPVSSAAGGRDLETSEPSVTGDAVESGASGPPEMPPAFDDNFGTIGIVPSDGLTSEGSTGNCTVGVIWLGDVVIVSLPGGLSVLDGLDGRPFVSKFDGTTFGFNEAAPPVGINLDGSSFCEVGLSTPAEFVAPGLSAETDTPIPMPDPVGF